MSLDPEVAILGADQKERRLWGRERPKKRPSLTELSHSNLSYFGNVQNYIEIKGNLKIVVY